MGRNLVVQLWGLGNLVQMEPLMRVLGEGDVLVDPNRSTHELAPLFSRWRFIQFPPTGNAQRLLPTWDPPYDDIYMGFPIAAMQFAQLGNRIHYPVWSFGEWDTPLYQRYSEMSQHTVTLPNGFLARCHSKSSYDWGGPPLLSIPDAPKLEKTIAVSLGYYRGDGGAWARKNWGGANLSKALDCLEAGGYRAFLVGKKEDFEAFDVRQEFAPLMKQVEGVAGCSGYLGNDTGFAHIAGALGLPSVVYTVEDKVKVRTAAPKLLQFGQETSPEQAVDWLIEAIEGGEKDGREEGALAQKGQANSGGG